MKNKNEEILLINNYNDANKKSEWNYISNDEYILSSINNGINPIINLLIDSIDRFTFGEILNDEIFDDKIKINTPPNNYLSINYKSQKEKDLVNENFIIKNIEDVIDYKNIKNNNSINKEKSDQNKICEMFTKEDFENKIKLKSNKRLNDSFEKKYYNPLKNDNNNNNQINKSEYKINEKNLIIKNNHKIYKNSKENNIEIKNNIINGNNNDDKNDYQLIIHDINLNYVKSNNLNEYSYDIMTPNISHQKDSVDINNISISNGNLKYDLLKEGNPKIKIEDAYFKDKNLNIENPKNEETIINLPLSLEYKENKMDKKNPMIFDKISDINVEEKLMELITVFFLDINIY